MLEPSQNFFDTIPNYNTYTNQSYAQRYNVDYMINQSKAFIEFDLSRKLSKELGQTLLHQPSNHAKIYPSVYGNSSLIQAAREGNINEIKKSHKSAELNATDVYSKTALMHALSTGNSDVALFLLKLPTIDIDNKDNKGNTALSITEKYLRSNPYNTDYKEIKDILLAMKLDDPLNPANIAGGALVKAIENKDYPDIAISLITDDNANVDFRDSSGNTPLMAAISTGQLELAELLIDVGANLMLTNNHGQTPLMLAVAAGKTQTVKMLLDMGANPMTSDSHGKTPIMLAAADGQTQTVKLLIAAGADLLAQDEFGKTPLMHACEHGNIEAALLLLENQEVRNTIALLENIDQETVLGTIKRLRRECPFDNSFEILEAILLNAIAV